MPSARPRELSRAFRRLSIDLADALTEITVPTFVLNRAGEIRWLNGAALTVFGDRRGDHYSEVVAPESLNVVNEQFTRKLIGTSRATSYEALFVDRDGQRFFADIDSVRLEDHGQVVGVFGVVTREHHADDAAAREVRLTPRQLEVLRLLAGGRSTDQIAERLQLSRETVRNHIRGILRAFGAHSRLEAVAHARARGIV